LSKLGAKAVKSMIPSTLVSDIELIRKRHQDVSHFSKGLTPFGHSIELRKMLGISQGGYKT
jgi:hypothetical protein